MFRLPHVLLVVLLCLAPSLSYAAILRTSSPADLARVLDSSLPALVYFIDSTDVNSMRFVQHHLPKVEKGLDGSLDIVLVDSARSSSSSSGGGDASYLLATMDVQAIPSLKLRVNSYSYREYDREWKADAMVAFALQMLPAVTTSSSSTSVAVTLSKSRATLRVNDKSTEKELLRATAIPTTTSDKDDSGSSSRHKAVVVLLLTEVKDKTTITAFRSAAVGYSNNHKKNDSEVRFVELKEGGGTSLIKELRAELVKGKSAVAVWQDGARLGVATDAVSARALIEKVVMA